MTTRNLRSLSSTPLPSSRAAAVFSPVVRLSVEVEPLLMAVAKHVKLTPKLRNTLARELTQALEHSAVRVAVGEPAVGARAAEDRVLTTEDAARLVGVSRPFMVKLIDGGAIALHQMVGNQRRVLHSAVLAWQQVEQRRQRGALKKLAAALDREIF